MIVNDILHEDLGTLAQLGVGPLINMIKQPIRYGRRREDPPDMYEIGKKFQTNEIGSTSEIRDIGVVKQGIKSIRKAFKDNEDAQGFALYIGGNPVMFTITDAYNLAGGSRSNRVAYDLRKYSDIIDRMYEKEYRKPMHTTVQVKEPDYFDRLKIPRPFAGAIFSTFEMNNIIELIQKIASELNQIVTAKLVMKDVKAFEKRIQRYSNREIQNAAKDLKTRLAIYKNSKRPTVSTIEAFVDMSIKNPGKTVQFAGHTYKLLKKTLDKVDPVRLLSGEPFKIYYDAIDPGAYKSVEITYRYERNDNQLIPIKATWYNKEHYAQQAAILDTTGYVKSYLKLQKLEQAAVIDALIQEFEANRLNHLLLMINALKKSGYAWPELGVLEKSAQTSLTHKD